MAESKEFLPPQSTEQIETDSDAPRKARPVITRRDFLAKTNTGAVAVGLATGTGFAATLFAPPAEGTETGPPKRTALPAAIKTRRVTLDVDGKKYDLDVDVRESLWETMNYQLGLANSNLGCDRAQCGACTVVVDGKAMNGCSLLTARLGRGQKILTVAGITTGQGPEGLHPVQRAFWLDGGFQCGICTRGFVMSSYALLASNKNPTPAEIKDALAGNICRCGEYTKIMKAVQTAAAEMRGEKVSYSAPLVAPAEVAEAPATPAGGSMSMEFEFVNPLSTIEQFDEISIELKRRPGILGVSGSERTVTPVWDPTKLGEAAVRQMLADTGHPVK
jgi:xanthine dehydrogenase YagT iron-sulfur-binding subunit